MRPAARLIARFIASKPVTGGEALERRPIEHDRLSVPDSLRRARRASLLGPGSVEGRMLTAPITAAAGIASRSDQLEWSSQPTNPVILLARADRQRGGAAVARQVVMTVALGKVASWDRTAPTHRFEATVGGGGPDVRPSPRSVACRHSAKMAKRRRCRRG